MVTEFDHTNFGQFSDLRFHLEIFVFSTVIFASSISSEIPIERLRLFFKNLCFILEFSFRPYAMVTRKKFVLNLFLISVFDPCISRGRFFGAINTVNAVVVVCSSSYSVIVSYVCVLHCP